LIIRVQNIWCIPDTVIVKVGSVVVAPVVAYCAVVPDVYGNFRGHQKGIVDVIGVVYEVVTVNEIVVATTLRINA
jgi:hypothetical protein